MNEADWTPSPHVERESATLRRRMRYEGKLSVWFAGITSVAAIVFGCVALEAFGHGALGRAVAEALFSLAFGAVTVWLAWRDNDLVGRVRSVDRTKREEFGSNAGWIVDLAILQGAATTGTDRGILWIEEGRLFFSGDRTSFALSSDQVGGRCQPTLGLAGGRPSTRIPLRHETAAGTLSLSVRTEENEASPLRYAIDRWALLTSTGGQLPPTRLGPGAVSASRLLLNATLTTGYWIFAASLCAKAFIASPPLGAFVVIFTLILGWLLRVNAVATHWRALSDLRRVRRD